MGEYVLSVGARHSVHELQKINAQVAVLQRQLSTGRKVNDPTDNPAAFFTSASLKSRAA